MMTSVAGAASARSLEVCGDDSGSSSQLLKFRQQEFAVRARRRAFALSASIEDVLVAAANRASDRLKRERPEFSAATLNKLAYFIPSLLGVGALLALFSSVSAIVLCTLAVLPAAFRILVVVSPTPRPRRASSAIAHEALPIYTVIAPFHREARVVDQLLSAIERLDYPAEKLDVIVIVEADEPATHAAITRRKHRLPITVVPAPPAGPRTKPKALNIALELARGSFVAIYDAEDRPQSSPGAGSANVRAGSKAGCRPSSSTCANRNDCFMNLARAVLRPFFLWSAGMLLSHWCTRFSSLDSVGE